MEKDKKERNVTGQCNVTCTATACKDLFKLILHWETQFAIASVEPTDVLLLLDVHKRLNHKQPVFMKEKAIWNII